ncbi:MAG: PAS domain S-box protein, partial [Planctomycetes bacterium]|nr:PAS domain S-box protein [Planctomycetota bacterium]
VTLDIAKGDLTRTVNIRSNDEIGQLSLNFNKMTKALGESYAELRYRARIEELIAAVSTNFINLAPDKIDTGINYALKLIGEFVGVDRSYVFLYADEEKKKMDNTHEWCADGIESQIENRKGLSVDRFPWGIEKLKRLETIHVPRVADLPDDANAEKELQQSQSVQSCVVVPMVYSSALVGVLGFDSIKAEKTWTEEDIALLKMAGEILVNALEHKRKEKMLQKAYDRLEIRVKERTTELFEANKLLEEEVIGHKRAREELKKYEILVSQINDLPYICDTKGNILFVNKTFEKLTGRKIEEFIGKSFAPLFNEENLKVAMDAYARTLKGESPQYELYFKGTGVLCEYKNLPLRDETGNIIGVIGTARDVTERKQMIDALRQAKDYAENLIETANVMVVGMDMAGNIRIFNKTAEEITGYKKTEIIGKNYFEVLVPKSRFPDVWQEFIRWQTNGQMQKTYESPVLTRTRVMRYVSWQTTEVREQGKVTGTISFGNDITEYTRRKELVERLRIMSFVKDVGVAITQGDTLREILQKCAESIVQNLNAAFARIWTLNEEENTLELQASAGMYTRIDGTHSRVQVGKFKIGLIAQERKPHLTNDLINDLGVSDRDWAKREDMIAFAGYPLIVKDRLVGVMAMFAHKPLPEYVPRSLASAADIIAVGIDRKYSEQIQLANLHYFGSMNKVSTALNQSMDISVTMQNVVDIIRSIYNCDRSYILYPCDPRASFATIKFLSTRPEYYTSIKEIPVEPEGVELIQMALDSKEPIMFDMTKSKHKFLYEKFTVQSLMIIPMYPIYSESGKLWVLGMHQCSYARKWTKDEQRLFKDISYKVADALTNMLLHRDLQLSEDKHRILLENLPQRIFYKDRNSIYVSCNENYARDLHIKPEEIVGKTDYDFFPKDIAEKYRVDDKRIIMSGQTEDIEEKYTKDDRELFINTIKTPIRDEEGNVIGILGVFWDITEKMVLQMETIRTRHLVSLGELAAGVAHEINNPLTGIINYAQILTNKTDRGSKEYDITSRIVKEGNRIANIVKSLLSFARPSDRKDKKVSVRIEEIFSDTLAITGAQLQKEGIVLKLNIPQKLPEITANPQQIQQVFLNIVSNARYALNQKYPEAHSNKILEISGEDVTINNYPYVRITFYDHGTGIPSDILNKVLDPFFTTKPRGKGTGLGLSISHGIINDHGGSLTIESVAGEFTKVSVVLPVVSKS